MTMYTWPKKGNHYQIVKIILAVWCCVVRSRDVSFHNFDGLAMSSLAFSVAPVYYYSRHELLYSKAKNWVAIAWLDKLSH